MPATSFSSAVATPGTPQRLSAGATPALPVLSGMLAGTITPRGTKIIVTADPGNTAAKNLWIGGPSLNVAANTGWSIKLAPGVAMSICEISNGSTDVADYWVDTDGTVAKYGVEVIG